MTRRFTLNYPSVINVKLCTHYVKELHLIEIVGTSVGPFDLSQRERTTQIGILLRNHHYLLQCYFFFFENLTLMASRLSVETECCCSILVLEYLQMRSSCACERKTMIDADCGNVARSFFLIRVCMHLLFKINILFSSHAQRADQHSSFRMQ